MRRVLNPEVRLAGQLGEGPGSRTAENNSGSLIFTNTIHITISFQWWIPGVKLKKRICLLFNKITRMVFSNWIRRILKWKELVDQSPWILNTLAFYRGLCVHDIWCLLFKSYKLPKQKFCISRHLGQFCQRIGFSWCNCVLCVSSYRYWCGCQATCTKFSILVSIFLHTICPITWLG